VLFASVIGILTPDQFLNIPNIFLYFIPTNFTGHLSHPNEQNYKVMYGR
jgi:hypothetical protein